MFVNQNLFLDAPLRWKTDSPHLEGSIDGHGSGDSGNVGGGDGRGSALIVGLVRARGGGGLGGGGGSGGDGGDRGHGGGDARDN